MKSGNKNKHIALLMLISELMIIGFSLYWLGSQYKKEKEGLEKDLYTYYKESYNVAIDSLLIDQFIEPVLGESGRLFSWERKTGDIEQVDSLTLYTAILDTDSIRNDRDAFVRIEINGDHDTIHSDAGLSYVQSRDSVLLRSIRLIIEKASDSTINSGGVVSGIGRGPDSLVFIEDYESRLNSLRANFTIAWLGTVSSPHTHRAIILKDWMGNLPPVMIKYPFFYHSGRILPQIIFTLVLVLVSTLAFILAYQSIRKQTRLNEMRNNFISNISHELKTPVSTVKIAIEALKKYDATAGRAGLTGEYLEMAGKEIRRLEQLISKVLDHSIIEEDATILNFEQVDLSALINDAIRSLQPRIEAAGARVDYHFQEEISIRCDPLYLQGVIVNLIDNSLKYGSGIPDISIDLSKRGDYAVLKVSDKGPGIPEEYINRVFDKFFRVPDRDLHNVKGYGLGLSFAYLIVKMHNGSIGVKNNVKGCTFTINIPVSLE